MGSPSTTLTLLFCIIVAKNRLGLGNFLGFNFWFLLSFLYLGRHQMLGSKKNQALFLGYAEQLRAASQYSLVSIERSFFCYVAVFRRGGREKTFCDYLSFGIFFSVF